MKLDDLEKHKYKLRSLPNFNTAGKYIDALICFGAVLAGYNFIAICLIYDDFTPRMPAIFIVALPLMLFHVYSKIESEYVNVDRDRMKDVIVHIRLNQMQSLKEKLESNPEVLSGSYDNKSLLYWARHHKNLEAHSLILNEMKKHQKQV